MKAALTKVNQVLRWNGWSMAGLSLVLTGLAAAQTSGVTSEQLQIFSSLDASQQQAILQNLGVGGAATGASSTAAASNTKRADSSRTTRAATAQTVSAESVIKADDTLLIEVDFPRASTQIVPAANGQAASVVTVPAPEREVPLTEKQRQDLRELIALVRSKNPYRISRDGALLLPGFVAMPLTGLTIEQATARVKADPAFRDLSVTLTLLPLEKSGIAALKPFGYDLFDEAPSTFAPVTDVPVPADYIVGPGDELLVQLYGSTNRTSKLTVGRDGRVSFPELGPISVGGKSFSAVQSDIEAQISRQMIGVRASVSMGETRSIRVFVLGEAAVPGSYTVSGLATMTTALFASGGVKQIGSLRTIQLKRQGNVVRTLDLYDLLLKGDTSDDAKLLPGDVIFIPTVSATVAIDGEVRRPAVYELKGNSTVADLVSLAGGVNSDADTGKASVTRVTAQQQRVVLDANLAGAGRTLTLRNGDSLTIPRLAPTLDSGVSLAGHVYAPRNVAWRDGLRLSDVITSVDELKPNADLHYVLIRRELSPDRRVAVLSVDLTTALAAKGGAGDLVLQPRDQITVFDYETDRAKVVAPILNELKLQSRADRPTEVVSVAGRIKVPGDYPLQDGMKVSDLIRAGGGLQDAAYTSTAEITRYQTTGGSRQSELLTVNLAKVVGGELSQDLSLQPGDLLTIKELSQWSDRENVTLKGEVRFPGTYTIQRGETLKALIDRAGGLTDMAFSAGAVFTREDLRTREQQQLDLLATRMQSDLAVLALQGSQVGQGNAAQSLSIGQSLLTQLKATKAVGRLVINLDQIIKGPAGSEADVVLRSGDTLVIPKLTQEVTVLGEVQTTTSHLYRAGYSRENYIEQSGGMTRKADSSQIYIVRADGSVVSKSGNRWFQNGVAIKPGDTIVVPLDTERMPTLPMWQAITQIVYNVAIAAAAINSF